MKHLIYRLRFSTSVHFGRGMLSESAFCFSADTLFSAFYIEALKLGREEELYSAVESGALCFSDAFPFLKERYFLPKPMFYVEPKDPGDSKEKKRFKKIQYIPAELLEDFFRGELEAEHCDLGELGEANGQMRVVLSRGWDNIPSYGATALKADNRSVSPSGDDTRPYCVGEFFFREGNGLYLIFALESDREEKLIEVLFQSLSYSGIGGKRSSGKGRFSYERRELPEELQDAMMREGKRYMLLCSALPSEEELESALEGASYLLQKRSGFILSENFSPEQQKKRDLYTFRSGSCFRHRFQGGVYLVNEGGAHPVYRYARGLFLGVGG